MKFKAAVLHEVGKGLSIDDITMDELKPTDVLIKVKASGLCHTELEVMHGAIGTRVPIVMGHEGAGVVEAVGGDVTRVKPGDHVVCSWNPHCGHCFYCVRDQPILCEMLASNAPKNMMPDGTSRLRLDGHSIHHFSYVASHAEYTVVSEAGAIPIPQAMPLDRACLIGCAVMAGVGGAIRIAKVAVGSSTVTLGCGMVGLSAIQGSRLAQAGVNIAIDVNEGRLRLAQQMGATHIINAKEQDPIEEVRRLTQGRGADYAFEAGGTEVTMQNSLEAVRPGGMMVILGKVPFQDLVRFRFGSLVGEKIITRSSYGGARPLRDFPMLAQFYLDGKLRLDELITKRITLEGINESFIGMARGEIVRSIIIFD